MVNYTTHVICSRNNHQVDFDILNFKIVFWLVFNMNMFLNFVAIVLNNHMFKGKCTIMWLTFCVTSLIFANILCLNAYVNDLILNTLTDDSF
jgi:hypothetical protein